MVESWQWATTSADHLTDPLGKALKKYPERWIQTQGKYLRNFKER